MRPTFLLAAILATTLPLAACGKNNQSGAEQNAGDGLTAENIVSNDVTAIDAVTGDAANMAADVDMNFGGLDENNAATSNQGGPRPSRRESRTASPAPEANGTANAAANAQ